jgi:hypothetical protein
VASGAKTSHTVQMIASLIVALLIVVVTISVVTARLGVGEDSGSSEDSRGRGRGRGRSGSDSGQSAVKRFAFAVWSSDAAMATFNDNSTIDGNLGGL